MGMKDNIVFIGTGVMGEALLRGMRDHLDPHVSISIVERDDQRADHMVREYQVSRLSLAEALAQPATIIIAVKPQHVDELLPELRAAQPGSLLISIVAGVSSSRFMSVLTDVECVRAMPNTPARIHRGITGLSTQGVAQGSSQWAAHLLESVGAVVHIPEAAMDALTAVSGSGPAYVFLLAEAMIDGATHLGLSKQEAQELVVSTLLGAAHLLADSGEDPAELRRQVTSPGGTTQAAIGVLQERGFVESMVAAMRAAHDRSVELT
jgi:pyrroline-5-carboxylate reductase